MPPAPRAERISYGPRRLPGWSVGFGRDAVIAALFTRRETDAFWVALTIPNALRQLLAEGAVSSAVVPVLSERLAKGGDEAGRAFFARARGVSLVVARSCVSLLGVLFAGRSPRLFAPGFMRRPDAVRAHGRAHAVMFPYIFFMGTAALGMAALNAKRQFACRRVRAGALQRRRSSAAAFALRGPLAGSAGSIRRSRSRSACSSAASCRSSRRCPRSESIGYATRPIFDFATRTCARCSGASCR